jgi:hypothetical protein
LVFQEEGVGVYERCFRRTDKPKAAEKRKLKWVKTRERYAKAGKEIKNGTQILS